MFNGVNPEQFHQFIASRSALPLPLPLTLPLHVSPFHELQPSQQVFQSHLLHPIHRQHSTHDDEVKQEERVAGRILELDGMRSESQLMDPWLKEEVLALLAIRSSLGNEFSDFIWSHVSRKLAELGFKRSAERCKEKFEEVSKYCNDTSYANSHYRSFNELEALFEDQTHSTSLDDKMERTNNEEEEEEQEKMEVNMEENSANETLENPIEENQYVVKKPKRKKKKKHHQFELLKGFSEFVNKIMLQQEELHKKLLQDMERREEERVAREEAWKKKEMEKLYKEMEIRAQEQAIACDRETKIIEFLNQFTSSNIIPQMQGDNQILKTPKSSNPPTPLPNALPQNPTSLLKETTPNNLNVPTSSAIVLSPPSNQVSSSSQNNPPLVDPPLHNPSPLTTQNPNTSFNEREDYGKRWPRDEVNSLINLRCNLQTNIDDKESTKAPLWERISQGMLELGYKRSAKKCKEKWENINKYFRKTKDANKKRPLDSKTCPYFHQLNTLYNQGRLIMPSEGPENNSNTPEKPTATPESGHQDNFQVNEGEKNMVQVPLEFEY